MNSKRALVVGLGIAGMSAAISLQKAGWTPIIVERAPQRRTGGYFIGMFPEGTAAAKRLGVYEDIHLRTPDTLINWELDGTGRRERTPGFLNQPGEPQAVLRGDIEAGLWAHIEGRIEVRYSTVPTAITTTDEAAIVTLQQGTASTTESFDLVVGADGLRSTTRRLAFGPDEKYMKSMNAMICAYQMSGPLPEVAAGESAVLAETGRSLWLFGLSDTAPTMLFTWRTKDIDAQFARPVAEVLRSTYAGLSGGGVVEHAIAEFEKSPQHLFDSVHQVKMRSWSTGRVVLVGDAAWCLTLYSGMGATMGMLGGAVLGEQRAEHEHADDAGGRDREPAPRHAGRIEDRNDEDRADVVDDGEREEEDAERGGDPPPEQR